MKKDNIICFRVSKDLQDSLKRVAQEDQRSLSSIIEFILTRYLKERKVFLDVKNEKRQYPRKTLSIPAIINKQSLKEVIVGAITEISLGGVKVLIPRDSNNEIISDSQDTMFEIVFTLPAVNVPIKLACESKRVVDSPDNIHIGAAFVDTNFQSYRALQAYLM
jgi:hypothetical protein